MTKLRPDIICCLLVCVGAVAQASGEGATPDPKLLAEQKRFVECLATVYSPPFWISYNDSLYFQARTEDQMRQLEAMKVARSRYILLTNREARHEIAAEGIADSGIDEAWQRKILLPFSATNQDLTPTLGRAVRVIPRYKVLQSLANGDALLQDDAATYFVMGFGHGAYDASGTNAVLIREGVKTYAEGGAFKTVGAFADVALSKEERAVLTRVAAAFEKQAAALAQEMDAPQAKDEFEAYKARATDSNPYMEFLLAKCYLEGKGTDKDESRGMDWMRRAARSGSGDATAYLEKLSPKSP